MSNKANGGAAFPGFDYYRSKPLPPEAQGMTLRDYMAAKVMQGVMASGTPMKIGTNHEEAMLDMAIAFYSMADAMLRAREAS